MNITKSVLDREMLRFTLLLYNNPLISREAVDEIISVFNNFISNLFIPYIKNQMEAELKSIASRESYCKALFILEKNRNLFLRFSKESSRFKTYEQDSFYVPPESFCIGEEPTHVLDDMGNGKVVMKPVFAAHIPLKKTFETVFRVPGLLKQMLQYATDLMSSNSESSSNVLHGDVWLEKHKLLSKDKIVLPLYFFFDEVETRSVLGSHSGEQKFGGGYVSFPCLPPHLNAKMENIFVSTVFHSKHLKKFGNEKIFCKVMDDFDQLSEEGIDVDVDGQKLTVYFECPDVLGDNLGMNMICGFQHNFRAKCFCRICSATSEQCQMMTVEDETLIRTVESYENDVLLNNVVQTGITERCIFNRLKNFHIIENPSVDLMHDLFEGVAVYTVGKVLQTLIQEKIISLDVLNNRIRNFPYSLADQNKPRPLYFTKGKKEGQKLKIKQSASETSCLVRYLSFMIGRDIPAKNEHWKLFRYLRRITAFLLCPEMSRGSIINFIELVRKHNSLYIKLFGHLKPKMHFLIHYARIMLKNGPPVHYSSMKFERKNKKVREAAIGRTSNVNLPLTITTRHQLQVCYNAEFCPPALDDVSLGPIKDNNAQAALKKLVPGLDETLSATTLKYVAILGKTFSTRTVFVTKINSANPRFGLLKEIFSYNDNIYFCAEEFTTITPNRYYHAYEVASNFTDKPLIINVKLIPRIPPCTYVKMNDVEFIVTRYDL